MSNEYSQLQFIVYELVLPYCTVCTPVDGLNQSFHTPVTCEESSDAEYSLFFTRNDSPILVTQSDLGKQSLPGVSVLNSKIHACIINASESTAKIKAGEGMASRGTMRFTASDFVGDPGPITLTDNGTFFGKLAARNVLQNKKILTHYYTITKNGLEHVETHTHFVDDFQLTGGQFTISGKDALKDIEAFGEKFPAISDITITSDIDESQITIPVNDSTDIAVGGVFRIEDELFYVQSKSGNNVTVAARGTSIVNGSEVVYKTDVSSHSSGSTVQPCYVMNNTFLSNVLNDIFTAVGLSQYIDFTQWNDEISTWTSQAYNFGVYSEPTKVSELLDKLCSEYMIDMWLDQPTQKVIVSATTAWKQSYRILEEGNDIQDLKIKQVDSSRFSRAFMYCKKEYKARNDDTINYGRLISASDAQSETPDFYGKVKEKDMGKSDYITVGSAQTTVSRYVQRFSRAPKEISFKIEERKLDGMSVADVVDIISRDTQTPDGQYLLTRDRAQILRIQPNLNDVGRNYNVSALTYVPLIDAEGGDLVITLSGALIDVNLYSRAGAPANAVNVTYIFDGCTIGSSEGVPAVRAGLFPSGSTIRIICTNNTKWSAKGGDGGAAYAPGPEASGQYANNGGNGGDSYHSDGIQTEIYMNYGNVDGYDTSSEIYASGGGGGGACRSDLRFSLGRLGYVWVSSGGAGGTGIPGGNGGIADAQDIQSQSWKYDKKTATDGNFELSGSSFPATATSITSLTSSATGGQSSPSSDGSPGTTSNQGATGNIYDLKGSGGIAGGAFKGTGITVYNLASESSKLRDGNSDSYTLIDS